MRLSAALDAKRQQHGGLSSGLGHLLTQHLPGLTLYLERGDIFACYSGNDTAWGTTEAEGRAEATRHQGDHH